MSKRSHKQQLVDELYEGGVETEEKRQERLKEEAERLKEEAERMIDRYGDKDKCGKLCCYANNACIKPQRAVDIHLLVYLGLFILFFIDFLRTLNYKETDGYDQYYQYFMFNFSVLLIVVI